MIFMHFSTIYRSFYFHQSSWLYWCFQIHNLAINDLIMPKLTSIQKIYQDLQWAQHIMTTHHNFNLLSMSRCVSLSLSITHPTMMFWIMIFPSSSSIRFLCCLKMKFSPPNWLGANFSTYRLDSRLSPLRQADTKFFWQYAKILSFVQKHDSLNFSLANKRFLNQNTQ